MIKRLRIKFVCVTMILLMAMLLIIFGMIYNFTARGMEKDSLEILQENPGRPGKPGNRAQPTFTVLMDPAGNLTVSGSDYFNLEDESWVRQVFEAAAGAKADQGVLEEYSLRYLRRLTPRGVEITMTDAQWGQNALGHLLRNFCIIGAVSFAAFLGISILLARWMVRPVEKAWQQQRQFVADASHELKTPLTVILTNAELLQSGQCAPEDQPRLSENILAMSRRMRGLVEDLLQLARGDNGQKLGQMEKLDFSDLALEAVMLLEPIYFEAGRTLESQIEEGLYLKGSRQHLRQVLEILLDNGRKYSAPGGTCVLTLARQGKKLQLRFFTPGTPLTPEQCRDVFKRFYRVDEARTGGSHGLGLAIAQEIVAQHQGRIWAESGKLGNTFFVSLPADM